ncbi:hypothetical protein [Streptomyces sp. NPDC002328]|uniref:hypothetical protein n=1 Tax=Streptomyces sp. NPDC002328 TaxID=3364642 RepID=UPI0036ABBCC6
MSTSPPQPPQQPEQPSDAPAQPSAYPHPQSPGPGAAAGQPQPAPAPGAQPGQPGFYHQPTLAGLPSQPQPQPGNPYLQQNPYGPAPAPPSGGGRGGAGRAVLWAVVGAVVASAAWAAGVFLLWGDQDEPVLRGYTAPANLCTGADYSSFEAEYTGDAGTPTHNELEDPALDDSYCSVSLKKSGSTYTDAYLSIRLELHKKTDPGPEFTARWKNYAEGRTGYDVDSVTGIGDEAYLVSKDTTGSSSSGSMDATLAVRDGWVTYEMSYSIYLSSYDEDKDPPELDEVVGWLKTDTRATLEELGG